MIKETIICDICGAVITNLVSRAVISYFPIHGVDWQLTRNKLNKDLCDNCYNKVNKFIKGEKI